MPKEKVVATGDAVVDWMPFLNDGYPEEWAQTVAALEKLDIVQIIPGHGEPAPKAHLVFFRGYLTDLVAAVKTAAAGGATLDEMKTKVADQLAPKYEKGMSRYPVGHSATASASTSRRSTRSSPNRAERSLRPPLMSAGERDPLAGGRPSLTGSGRRAGRCSRRGS